MSNDINKGIFEGIARLFSFVISFAIGGFFGLSIVKETIPASLFAIFGGFIGYWIFIAWWNNTAKSSNSPTFKAFVFTIFTLLLLAGIIFLALGKV